MLLSADTLLTRRIPDIDGDDTPSLDVLGELLAACEAKVCTWLRYPAAPSELGGVMVLPTLSSRDYVLYPRLPRAGRPLVLAVAPVTAITSIKRSLSADWLSDGTDPADVETYAVTDYREVGAVNAHYLHLRLSGAMGASWPRQADTIQAVITAGYADEESAPPDLVDAVYKWAADEWVRRRVRLLSSSSQGGASQSYRDLVIPADVTADLAPYRMIGAVGAA